MRNFLKWAWAAISIVWTIELIGVLAGIIEMSKTSYITALILVIMASWAMALNYFTEAETNE